MSPVERRTPTEPNNTMKTTTNTLVPAPTAKTLARAEHAARQLENPGKLNLDDSGVRVITRRLDTYANDSREEILNMRQILEAVASGNVEVSFWWIDQNEQLEVVDYERFMNLADNLSGAFA